MSVKARRGDTLLEVAICIVIYAVVAAISISMMNRGTSTAQTNLEITMARNEIDAQTEALRFIHNSFLSERELSGKEGTEEERSFEKLWKALSRDASSGTVWGLANLSSDIADFNLSQCSEAYEGEHSIVRDHAFILNTRNLNPDDVEHSILRSFGSDGTASGLFTPTALYPRILYGKRTAEEGENSDTLWETEPYDEVELVEGIWILAVREDANLPSVLTPQILEDTVPEYFNFHIRTCWYAPGRNNPTTIGTVIRLYNPEAREAAR